MINNKNINALLGDEIPQTNLLKQIGTWVIASLILFGILAISPANAAEKTTKLPMLKEAVKAGHIITKADLKLVEVTGNLPLTVISSTTQMVGQEAVRNLRANTPLYVGYVRTPPQVHKNTEVKVSYNQDGIHLSTLAKALEDGVVGDNIKLLPTASSQFIIGKVVAKGHVEVK